MVHKNINSAINNARNSIRQRRSVNPPRGDTSQRRKEHTGNQQWKILNRISMRRLIPLEHVQLSARDLAFAHSRLAVFGEVFPWRDLVVKAVPLLQGARGEDAVGEDEVEC